MLHLMFAGGAILLYGFLVGPPGRGLGILGSRVSSHTGRYPVLLPDTTIIAISIIITVDSTITGKSEVVVVNIMWLTDFINASNTSTAVAAAPARATSTKEQSQHHHGENDRHNPASDDENYTQLQAPEPKPEQETRSTEKTGKTYNSKQ